MDERLPTRQTPAPPPGVARNPVARWLWISAGFVLVGIGGLGMILPVLPTTVFFIGAAACFARSSPRFERWVLNLPRIGPLVRDYRAGLGMPRRAKYIAISMIVVAVGLSSLALSSWTPRLAAYGLAMIGVWYISMRVPTRPEAPRG